MQQPLEQPYVKTGGARIGWMNVTWPFAELCTAPERLTITAQFLGTGRAAGHPGWFACVALFLVYIISLGTLTSTSLQRLVLTVNEKAAHSHR